MRILFILASDLIYRKKGWFTLNNGFAPLSLTTLAACVPEKYNAHIEIVDEGMQRVNYDKKQFDIVCISCCASSSNRAYELSRYWQKRGVYTAIGGSHATLCPGDVAPHCHSVMMGYGEGYFAHFIDDFVAGRPQKKYQSKPCDGFLSAPAPRRDLIRHIPYYFKNTVVANRGCSNKCRFCAVSQFNNHQGGIKRPVDEVIDEIKHAGFKKVAFMDPSAASDREYAKEFFTALIPLKLSYYIDVTVGTANDEELLDLMQKSGCYEILTGIESFNPKNLVAQNKDFNIVQKYKEYISKFHERGISVLGSFVVGMDHDTPQSITQLPDLIAEIGVDLPKFSIFTPLPGTEPYQKYKEKGLLLTHNFDYYDLMHTVFQHNHMTPSELQSAFYRVWQKTYSINRILSRLKQFPDHRTDLLLQNLYFKHLGRKIPKKVYYLTEQPNGCV